MNQCDRTPRPSSDNLQQASELAPQERAATQSKGHKPSKCPLWDELLRLMHAPIDLHATGKHQRDKRIRDVCFAFLLKYEAYTARAIAKAGGPSATDPDSIVYVQQVAEFVLNRAYEESLYSDPGKYRMIWPESPPQSFLTSVVRRLNIGRDYRAKTMVHPLSKNGCSKLRSQLSKSGLGPSFPHRFHEMAAAAILAHTTLTAKFTQVELDRHVVSSGLLRQAVEQIHGALTTDTSLTAAIRAMLKSWHITDDILRAPLVQALRDTCPELTELDAYAIAKFVLWPLSNPLRAQLLSSNGEDDESDSIGSVDILQIPDLSGAQIVDLVEDRLLWRKKLSSLPPLKQLLVLLYVCPFASTRQCAALMRQVLGLSEPPLSAAEINTFMSQQVAPILPLLDAYLSSRQQFAVQGNTALSPQPSQIPVEEVAAMLGRTPGYVKKLVSQLGLSAVDP